VVVRESVDIESSIVVTVVPGSFIVCKLSTKLVISSTIETVLKMVVVTVTGAVTFVTRVSVVVSVDVTN